MMLSFPPSMPIQEDLAALLARNLVLTPELATSHQQTQQEQPRSVEDPNQSQAIQTEPAPIVYSISQHYHHSTHIVRQQPQQSVQEQETHAPQRPSSEPPQSEHESCESILRSHGIDPSALSLSQTQLFRVANLEQRMRLLELWSISPPTNQAHDATLAWHNTTMEQEEHLARMRYERQQQQQQQSSMEMDCGNPFQGSDSKWLYSSSHVEPYMENGMRTHTSAYPWAVPPSPGQRTRSTRTRTVHYRRRSVQEKPGWICLRPRQGRQTRWKSCRRGRIIP